MINVGLYGATGYTGFETLKILKNHPQVKLVFATSESMAGQSFSKAYPVSWDIPLIAGKEAPLNKVQAVFCCLPHSASMPAVIKAREAGVRVIDLSADFRLQSPTLYEQWYNTPHAAPNLLNEAVYGIPEINREAVKKTDLLANPGCYPTSILLGLYPLLKANLLNPQAPIIADSKSGVSGAGRKLSLKTHFVEANENLSPYNIGQTHRHIAEINQGITHWGNISPAFIFSPHLVPISRGMLSTIYVSTAHEISAADIQTHFEETYANETLMRVLPAGELASFAHTQCTNACAISVTAVSARQFIICSSIDNLGKGAAGQAVQNFNLMFGLPETEGLLN